MKQNRRHLERGINNFKGLRFRVFGLCSTELNRHMKTNQLIEQGIGIENGEKNLLDYLSKRKGGKTTTLNSSTSKDLRYVIKRFQIVYQRLGDKDSNYT